MSMKQKLQTFLRDLTNRNPKVSLPPLIGDDRSGQTPAIVTALVASVGVFDAITNTISSFVARYTFPGLATLLNYAAVFCVTIATVYFITSKQEIIRPTLSGDERTTKYQYCERTRLISKIVFFILILVIVPLTIYWDIVFTAELPAYPSPITGKLVCKDSGEGVDEARIWVKDSTGRVLTTNDVQTDAQGIFYIAIRKSIWVPYTITVRQNGKSSSDLLRTMRLKDGYWTKEVRCEQ